MDYNPYGGAYIGGGNNGDYDRYKNLEEKYARDLRREKSKTKVILLALVAVLIIINIAVSAVLIQSVKQDARDLIESERAGLASQVTDEVKENIIRDATQAVLDAYLKQNSLPSDYVTAGTYVAAKCTASVLELSCYNNSSSGSVASGFILNNDGYVFTNAHVVTYDNSGRTGVYTNVYANFAASVTKYKMEVVDYNTKLDLAILRFVNKPAAGVLPVKFGAVDKIVAGQDAVVIGNAQGMGTSVTAGIVSRAPTDRDGVNVIQIDAPINPGNSGGPVFNAYGNLLGVASYKIVASDANEGLGFAISVKTIEDYIRQVNSSLRLSITFERA